MIRTEIQVERLRTLSRELRKVKPIGFDISEFVSGSVAAIGCGSTACALGYCPLIFPSDWYFMNNGWIHPSLKDCGTDDAFRDAEGFFGLSAEEVLRFFDPEAYEKEEDGEWFIEAYPSDVADRIDELLARAEA